jgi:hypothetical protein
MIGVATLHDRRERPSPLPVAPEQAAISQEGSVRQRVVRRAGAGVTLVAIGLSLVLLGGRLRSQAHPAAFMPLYNCAQSLRPLVGEGLLVVTGGSSSTLAGLLPSAHNAPYLFYWLDRKGFAVSDSELSLEHLEMLRRRGARYFAGERERFADSPGFEASLLAKHRLLGRCDGIVLLEILPPSGLLPTAN